MRRIEYRLPLYRLATTLPDHKLAPSTELAALYHERWEIETAFDELKTHLRGAPMILRSKTPDLVRQEFYGLLMTHFGGTRSDARAALNADKYPDQISFLHPVRVVRRKMAAFGAIPPQDRNRFHNAVQEEIPDEFTANNRNRRNPRGVKRKMRDFPLRRGYRRLPLLVIFKAVMTVK